MTTTFWQRWFPEDREAVRERYLATKKAASPKSSLLATTRIPEPSFTGAAPQRKVTGAQPPTVQLVSAVEEITSSAAKLGVTPLYLAVLRQDVPLATKLLQRPKVACEDIHAHCIPHNKAVLPFSVRRLPQLPTTALELAIALDDEAMVSLLMRHGALLQVPKQLTLDQLADRSFTQAEAPVSPSSAPISRKHSGLAVARSSRLGAFDSLGLPEAFLEDDEVQRTLAWRDYEAALLTQASPGIVEALLRRQGYQLTLNHSSNPHELAQLFETAVTAGNAYVVQAMVSRGVDVNAPTFRRAQLPLCAATNALQPGMVETLLDLDASLHDEQAQDMLWQAGAQQPVWLPLPNACHMLVRALHRHEWPDVAQTPLMVDDVQRAAHCIEVLLHRGARPGPRLVEMLEAELPLADAEPAQRSRALELLRQVLGLVVWSPVTHINYPLGFKKAAAAALLLGADVVEGGPLPTTIEEQAELQGEEGGRDDAHHLVAQLSGALRHHGMKVQLQYVQCIEVLVDEEGDEHEEALERQRREITTMFAHASEQQIAQVQAMAEPLSRWLGICQVTPS